MPDFPSQQFSKKERLCKKKDIQELFAMGKAFTIYPLRVLYVPATDPPNKVLISVPKRSFKKAADRNLLKRRIREAYRTQKNILLQQGKPFHIAFVYLGREILNFNIIDKKLKEALFRLVNK